VVQSELSKIISRLVVEILAGTEEEDEYAAALYLRASEAECLDDDDNDHDDCMECDMEEHVDEDAFPIEEADSDEESVDFLAKQMDLMEDDENEEEAEENADEDDYEVSAEQSLPEVLENEDEDGVDDMVDDEDNVNDDDDEEDPVNAPHGRGAHLSALFFRTFLRTILQNWAKMDKYRIDKFYTLLRFLMERMYSYCASRGWNTGMIRLFNDALCDEVLSKVPNGVRCHLIDVCLDELVKHQEDVTEAVFLDVVQPFLSMAQTGVDGNDLVHIRAVENVLDRFLDQYSVFAETKSELRFQQVHVGTVAQFLFDLASDEMTQPRYRPRLYDVYKKYIKCIRLNGEENDVDISQVNLSLDEEDAEGCASVEEGEDAVDGGDAAEEEDMEEKDPESKPVVQVVEPPKPKLVEKKEAIEHLKADRASKKEEKKMEKHSNEIHLASVKGKPQQETVISDKAKAKILSQIGGKVQKEDAGEKDDRSIPVVEVIEPPKSKHTRKKDVTEHLKADRVSKMKEKKMKKQSTEIHLASSKGRPQQETVISDDWEAKIESQIKGKVHTENEIVISLEEQRNAKAMMKRGHPDAAATKKRQREQLTENLSESGKKVKFGEVNRAKSHKASMKALKQVSPASGLKPDQGILKNKDAKIALKKHVVVNKKRGRGRVKRV
jgi:Nucleolar protein,Nop52